MVLPINLGFNGTNTEGHTVFSIHTLWVDGPMDGVIATGRINFVIGTASA